MDLFGKIRIANEHMEHAGREGIVVTSRHKRPLTDDVAIKAFHPTTGAGRSYLMSRTDVEELHEALTKWLAEGWAGFVDGAPGPGGGIPVPSPDSVPARPTLDELERRSKERAEQDRRLDEIRRGEYASATHDELVDEIRRLKFNYEGAKTDVKNLRASHEANKAALVRMLRRVADLTRAHIKNVPTASLLDVLHERDDYEV